MSLSDLSICAEVHCKYHNISCSRVCADDNFDCLLQGKKCPPEKDLVVGESYDDCFKNDTIFPNDSLALPYDLKSIMHYTDAV